MNLCEMEKCVQQLKSSNRLLLPAIGCPLYNPPQPLTCAILALSVSLKSLSKSLIQNPDRSKAGQAQAIRQAAS
jgi:hypothetical protein